MVLRCVMLCWMLQVGYSSESDDEGERHPVDPSEHHTYEVSTEVL